MLKKIVFSFSKDEVIKNMTIANPFSIKNIIADLIVGNFFMQKRGVLNV